MKRFLAMALMGTMLMQQSVIAAEMPEGYWAAEAIEAVEAYDFFTAGQYADFVTYEAGSEMLNNYYDIPYSYNIIAEDIRFFDVVNYTNGYITRGQWAEALNLYIDSVYEAEKAFAEEYESDEAQPSISIYADKQNVSYADVNENDEGYEGINTCHRYELMEGYQDKTFKPNEFITYAEAAVTLTRLENNMVDILIDKGIPLDRDNPNFGFFGEELYSVQVMENLEDIMAKAEAGTLKSDKTYDSSTEKAINEIISASESLHSEYVSIKRSNRVDGTVNAYGEELKGNITASADVAMQDNADGEIDKLAFKLNFKTDIPVLKVFYGEAYEEFKDFTVEMYIKDGNVYMNFDGEKMFTAYESKDDLPNTSYILNYYNNTVLEEYLIREGLISASVKENKDGSKVIDTKLDIKKIFSALGCDIDRLFGETAGGESLEINLAPAIQSTVITGEGKLDSTKESFNISFDYTDEYDGKVKGDIKITDESSYDYEADEITFPDFSDYEDATAEYEYLPEAEADEAIAVIGNSYEA